MAKSKDRDQQVWRIVFQQPTLAEYRIAFYKHLSSNSDLQIKVAFSESPRIKNCDPDGFDGQLVLDNEFFGGRLFWSKSQLKFAKKAECDVLVFCCNIRYLSLLPGILRAKMNGVRVVLWGHHFSKSNFSVSKWVREKILFRLADSIVCYGNRAAADIRKLEHCKEKTFVALNAIDQQPIVDAQAKWHSDFLDTFRATHGIGNGPNLLFISRIKPRNRLEVMVQTLKKLKSVHPQAMGFVIGQHNEEQRRIEQLAIEAGIGGSILFPGAIYDQYELAPWFLSADIFFYPCQVGLSMFHGFGYGLPAVVGDHPHLRNPELDSLDEGINGHLFLDGDVDDAVNQILRVVSDPAVKEQMSNSAKKTVEELHSIENMANSFADAIRFAINKK